MPTANALWGMFNVKANILQGLNSCIYSKVRAPLQYFNRLKYIYFSVMDPELYMSKHTEAELSGIPVAAVVFARARMFNLTNELPTGDWTCLNRFHQTRSLWIRRICCPPPNYSTTFQTCWLQCAQNFSRVSSVNGHSWIPRVCLTHCTLLCTFTRALNVLLQSTALHNNGWFPARCADFRILRAIKVEHQIRMSSLWSHIHLQSAALVCLIPSVSVFVLITLSKSV